MIAALRLWRGTERDGRLVYFFSMGTPVFLVYLLLTFNSRVQPNWIAPAVLPLFCVMVIYWDKRLKEGARSVKPWLATGVVLGALMAVVMLDTNLVGKIAGQPLPAKLDPLRRVRGNAEMARVVDEVKNELAREGKPVFIIGNHYGITSLLTFYLTEARAHVTDMPLVFSQPTLTPQSQYYFWPGYEVTRRGQNALFVRYADTTKLAFDWFPKWWRGEAHLLAQTLVTSPPPEWLLRQFDSVTNTGLHPVFYRGQVLHTIEIFACRNLH
jgi:hypothetical protein